MGITNTIPPSRLIQPGVIDNAAARPASPYEGQTIFQKDTDQLLVWNGTAWVIPNQTTTNPNGLELVKKQDFSGATNVDVTSVFTSEYINYRVLVRVKGNTTASLYLRTMIGTTLQTDIIYSISSGFRYSSGSGNVTASTRGDSFSLAGAVAATYFSDYAIEFGSPQVASYTNIAFQGVFQFTATDHDLINNSSRNVVTTQIDGFQLTAAGSANIDGTVRVYGYRNS